MNLTTRTGRRTGRIFLIAIAILALSGLPASASGLALAAPVAVHGGSAIALSDVVYYHCHDGAYPIISCFDSAAERDQDLLAVAADGGSLGDTAPDTATVLYYVTWFAAANYGGSSFTASASYADLGLIGWNDSISSFKSLNNGRPKWWQATNFTGTAWHWLAGAQVSYVGDGANDQFSSVANVP
jgi:hypothetical protein